MQRDFQSLTARHPLYVLEKDAESIIPLLTIHLAPAGDLWVLGGMKVPVLSKPGKLLSRNLLFAADAVKGL